MHFKKQYALHSHNYSSFKRRLRVSCLEVLCKLPCTVVQRRKPLGVFVRIFLMGPLWYFSIVFPNLESMKPDRPVKLVAHGVWGWKDALLFSSEIKTNSRRIAFQEPHRSEVSTSFRMLRKRRPLSARGTLLPPFECVRTKTILLSAIDYSTCCNPRT